MGTSISKARGRGAEAVTSSGRETDTECLAGSDPDSLVQERVGASGAANAGLPAVIARIFIITVAAAMEIQPMGIGSEVTAVGLGISPGPSPSPRPSRSAWEPASRPRVSWSDGWNGLEGKGIRIRSRRVARCP